MNDHIFFKIGENKWFKGNQFWPVLLFSFGIFHYNDINVMHFSKSVRKAKNNKLQAIIYILAANLNAESSSHFHNTNNTYYPKRDCFSAYHFFASKINIILDIWHSSNVYFWTWKNIAHINNFWVALYEIVFFFVLFIIKAQIKKLQIFITLPPYIYPPLLLTICNICEIFIANRTEKN